MPFMLSLSNAPSETPCGLPFPPEVLHEALSFLPQSTLRSSRLVNRQFHNVATPLAFNSLRLEVSDGRSAFRFKQVALDPRLRFHVREVTCDMLLADESSDDEDIDEAYGPPTDVVNSLPYLQYFSALKSLHIRLEPWASTDAIQLSSLVCLEETRDFKYRILETIFSCLSGTWSRRRQLQIDQQLGFPAEVGADVDSWPTESSCPQIPVETLTVCNLPDTDDYRLTGSPAFRHVLNLGSITTFGLSIVSEVMSDPRRPVTPFSRSHTTYDALLGTWLSPALTRNLRKLSLYSQCQWTWCPQPCSASTFPKLQTLALGGCVFDSQDQILWISSLAEGSPEGGLIALYLDHCRVMSHPVDQALPVEGKTAEETEARSGNAELRWHHVLRFWKNFMPALRVFKMGESDCGTSSLDVAQAIIEEEKPCDQTARTIITKWARHLCAYNEFRFFECPEPTPTHQTAAATANHGCYRLGSGMRQRRRDQMWYAQAQKVRPGRWGAFLQITPPESELFENRLKDLFALHELLRSVSRQRS